MTPHPFVQGAADVAEATERLAARLPEALRPLAPLAYNYRWSWTPGGGDVFRDVDPERWARVSDNPVRFLAEVAPLELERAAADTRLVERIRTQHASLAGDLARDFRDLGTPRAAADRPLVYVCAEFGLHPSLPIYSGGLGVLAGDILKEASDLALPMIGVGLLYRRGYFHQRLDHTGWQHEYWTEVDPDLLPAALVKGDDGGPLTIHVPIWDHEVAFHVWRVDVGRVPLFLLDAEVPGNSPVDRWITSRLYDGNRDVRLSQYAALGVGGIRTLRALAIDPGTLHLNEGHGALAALELAADEVARGADLETARERVRERVVFTTHTPVPAGNETYEPSRVLDVIGALHTRLGIDPAGFLALGRVDPDDHDSEAGMTPIALRFSRGANGVSERHGAVARQMWAGLFRVEPDDTPITHVTNGVHLPSWMSVHVRELLDRYLDDGWHTRAADPDTWAPVEDIPDAELWQARVAARTELIDQVRDRIATDRLARGNELDYVQVATRSLSPDTLTLGFARRVATYKRLYLLRHDPDRVLKLVDDPDPVQLLFAGKAHPSDDGAKGVLRSMFEIKGVPHVAERVAFLEDYDISLGRLLTAGCDVWVNVPRPPLEASGTSGMKSALNGGLNLSVLDGWWAEGFDAGDAGGPGNGWGLEGDEDPDHAAQDHRDAQALYDTLEHQVIPLFHDRDADGVPVRWIAMVKRALRTVGPQFCATRMLHDYERRLWP